MVVLFIWVLCGFGCYKLADNNGRDKATWCILGFIFGLFALLILALMGKAESETDKQIFSMNRDSFLAIYKEKEEMAKENTAVLRVFLMFNNGEKVKSAQLEAALTALKSI